MPASVVAAAAAAVKAQRYTACATWDHIPCITCVVGAIPWEAVVQAEQLQQVPASAAAALGAWKEMAVGQ